MKLLIVKFIVIIENFAKMRIYSNNSIFQKFKAVFDYTILIFCCMLIAIFIYEIYNSWNSYACGFDRITANCYPWGGEGPAAGDDWSYATKENYQISLLYNISVLSVYIIIFYIKRFYTIVLFPIIFILFINADNVLPVAVDDFKELFSSSKD